MTNPREEFQWAYRWLDTDGNVLDEMDTRNLSFETAEERAHRLAANRPASVPGGAVVRYRVVTTEEVVATYPEVKPPTEPLPRDADLEDCPRANYAVERVDLTFWGYETLDEAVAAAGPDDTVLRWNPHLGWVKP